MCIVFHAVSKTCWQRPTPAVWTSQQKLTAKAHSKSSRGKPKHTRHKHTRHADRWSQSQTAHDTVTRGNDNGPTHTIAAQDGHPRPIHTTADTQHTHTADTQETKTDHSRHMPATTARQQLTNTTTQGTRQRHKTYTQERYTQRQTHSRQTVPHTDHSGHMHATRRRQQLGNS